MKKGACVAANNASAPLQPRTVTNEVRTMLTATQPDWQARLADDPGYLQWIQRDEEERIAALAAEDEARRNPYGRPENDAGWFWESPTWGSAP